jgi:parvulin-like peptidyl-prolyl isomerase
MRNPLLILLAALVALSFGLAAAQDAATQTQEDDPVVLRLGDRSETLSAFEERYTIAVYGVAAQQGLPVTDELRAQLEPFKPRFLEQRVMEYVLLDAAEAQGYSVSDEEVEAELESLRANVVEGDTFEDLLQRAGFTDEAQLRDYLREQLLIERFVSEVQAGIAVSDEDIQATYERYADQLTEPEQVCARHILVETREEAETLLAELQGGADFAELAREHSTDPGSGAQGGDLGCFAAEMMVAPFAEAAFAAELDTPTGPVESQFGHHLILVYDRLEAGTVPLEEVRDAIVNQLQQEGLQAELTALREASGVEVFPEVLGVVEE